MKSIEMQAFPRNAVGRNAVNKLRSTGRVPATIYGRNTQPQNLEIGFKAVSDLIKHSVSENVLVDLKVEGDARPLRLALMQEVQHDPLSRLVVHVDFHEVKEDEPVVVQVPVESVGEAKGVKEGGGVLEHVLFKLRVRALPKALPEQIIVDVSHLEIGKSVHIREIKAPEGVEIIGNAETVVFAVAAPKTEEVVEATAEAKSAGEVEMTKEKKADGNSPAAGDKKPDAAAEKKAEKPAAKK